MAGHLVDHCGSGQGQVGSWGTISYIRRICTLV